jgi:5-methylcytosine-specific restriction endonuclease McrA
MSGGKGEVDPYYQKAPRRANDRKRYRKEKGQKKAVILPPPNLDGNLRFFKLSPDLAKGLFKPRRFSKIWWYECDYCGKLFPTGSHNRKREATGFCNPQHEDKWRSQQTKENWQKPWYRDRQRKATDSPETRKRRSLAARKRRPLSHESRMKGAAKNRGPLHPRWKGRILSSASEYINSSAWKRKSKEIQKRNKHTCQACGYTRKELKKLNATELMDTHHGYPLGDWMSRGYEPGDYPDSWLATLCRPCHTATDHADGDFKQPISSMGDDTKESYPKSIDESPPEDYPDFFDA